MKSRYPKRSEWLTKIEETRNYILEDIMQMMEISI